jgi:hypothetical protein
MKRTLTMLLPVLAVVVLLFAGEAFADAASPGSCFGSGSHDDEKQDASKDAIAVLGQRPTRSSTRRTGIGLVSAAFATSGWLYFRPGPEALTQDEQAEPSREAVGRERDGKAGRSP